MVKDIHWEVRTLLMNAMALIMESAPSGPALTQYGNLDDKDKSVVNAISIAIGRMEEKQPSEDFFLPLPSVPTGRRVTGHDMKKWGRQNLRISKAVNRMSKKGFNCPRG